MHPDLSPHLHSEQCNELIQLLQDCHKDNPFLKFLGTCNSESNEMTKCLKEEYVLQRERNFEKAQAMKKKLQESTKHPFTNG